MNLNVKHDIDDEVFYIYSRPLMIPPYDVSGPNYLMIWDYCPSPFIINRIEIKVFKRETIIYYYGCRFGDRRGDGFKNKDLFVDQSSAVAEVARRNQHIYLSGISKLLFILTGVNHGIL
jgi:hypothetical protein